ncbi:MAG: methyltransferase domain-containing protein [Chlamydiota bacterium]
MSPRGSHWKTAEAVEAFLKGRRGAIPAAALQIEIIGTLIDAWRPAPGRVLDLGCGDGILGRTVLERFPEARVWFADFSDPMLKAAREKLKGVARARVVKADFGSKKWVKAVGEGRPFDVVVSGFAIHHQPHERKRALYREIYDMLATGGLFLNLDHVKSPTAEIEEVFTDYFVDHLFRFGRSSGSARSRKEIEEEYRARPDKRENVLAPLDEQCRWLREIGFADTDCYFRVLELALFGGRKVGK